MSESALKVRDDFPILSRRVNDRPLVYLDNAATTQKPKSVIDAMAQYYLHTNANVHRGVHTLGREATNAYEDAREEIARFIGCKDIGELVLTRGTTESLNLLSRSLGEKFVQAGDVIVVLRSEHHSNFVPWQALAKRVGARFHIAEVTAEGLLDETSWQEAMALKPKVVSFALMSNVLGTRFPVEQMAKEARSKGAFVILDAAQGILHEEITENFLSQFDAMAFSAHKMCGPTGVGALWARRELLEEMPPFLFGGEMIGTVSDQESTWNTLPYKFEAGTPPIAEAIGFAEAIRYLERVGRDAIIQQEQALSKKMFQALKSVEGLTLVGAQKIENGRGPVFSFYLDGIHIQDLAQFLDLEGVAIRTGHHCAEPLMRRMNIHGTARASLTFYNTERDVEVFIESLKKAREYF